MTIETAGFVHRRRTGRTLAALLGTGLIAAAATVPAAPDLEAADDAPAVSRSPGRVKPLLPGVTRFAPSELMVRKPLRPAHPPGLVPDQPLSQPRRAIEPQREGDWQRFLAAVPGDWNVSWDAFTGRAGSVAGGPGPALGPDLAAGARALLLDHAALFGIESADRLALDRVIAGPDSSVVSFALTVGGVPVHDLRIGVVTDSGGRLLAISGSFPAGLVVAAQPRLAPADALGSVVSRLPGGHGLGRSAQAGLGDPDFTRPRLIEIGPADVLPEGSIPVGLISNAWMPDGGVLRPAWVVALGIAEGGRSVEASVDAATGRILASRWLDYDSHENINVYDDNPDHGPIVVRQINDGDKPGTGGILDGNWTNATNGQVLRIQNAPYNHTTDPNNPNANKNFDEQMAFYTGGRLNRYFVNIAGTNIIGSRNYNTDDVEMLSHAVDAGNNDNSIGNYSSLFDRISAGHGTFHVDNVFGLRDFALEADFWAHEYAHRVNGDTAAFAGTASAGAMNEGVADYFSSSFTDEKYQGDFADAEDEVGDESGLVCCFNGFIRSVENTRTYSDVCDNFFVDPAGSTCRPAPDDNLCCEVHSDGEIYAGALWDVRRLFINAEGKSRGVTRADKVAFQHLINLGGAGTEDFIKGRDQMLAADASLYASAHECLIWKAFAGREIGVGANNALPVPATSTALPAQCQNLAEVSFNQGSFNCGSGQKGRVLVTDPNGGTVATVTVTTDSGDSETFALTWTGSSAETAPFDITTGAPAPGNGSIQVSGAGDTIRASFSDNSPSRTVTAGADIDCEINVRLKGWRFERGSCDGDDPFLDAGETATLVVTLENLETGGTLSGAQFLLTSNNPRAVVNAPATQIVHDVSPGGEVELRFSVTATTPAAQESVTFTLTGGGGTAYPTGPALSFTDTLESDIVEVSQSRTWNFPTAPPARPGGATYPNSSCQNPNLGTDDWCTTANGPTGTETFNWYNAACSNTRPHPAPNAGYWLQGSSPGTNCSGSPSNKWNPAYNANDSSWLVSPAVRIQPPGARFKSRLDRVDFRENVDLGPEAATALFIQGDLAYLTGQIEQITNALGDGDGTPDNTPYSPSTGGWRLHDPDGDGTSAGMIQVGKFGSEIDLGNGRIRFRFLFLGKDDNPPDPSLSGQDGYYVDNFVFRWTEKQVGNDATSSCNPRDSRLLYGSLEVDDGNPAEGNGNGRADPGETLVLKPILRGALNDSSRGVSATLTSDMPSFVTIVDGSATYPDIVPGETERPDAPFFKVTLSPSIPCGSVVGMTLSVTHNGVPGKSVVSFPLRVGVFSAAASPAIVEDFEASNGGWTRNAGGTDTATDGLWEWVDPLEWCYNQGSGSPPAPKDCVNFKTTQPGNDANPGTATGKAWITENGLSSEPFNLNDVDGGETSIRSGNYDLTAIADPIVSYARHYYSREGFAVDSLDFEVSTDGGTTWTTTERFFGFYGIFNENDGTLDDVDDGPLNGGWSQASFNLRDQGLVPTATTRFRVKVRDVAHEGLTGQIVEAGFDDLKIRNNVGGSCEPFGGGPALAGEAAKADPNRLKVTNYDAPTGDITITYGPACSATDHTIVFGDLANVASYGYSGQDCNVGTTGTATFNPGSGSFFFVIVGNNGTKEGSYGRDSAGAERPEALGLPGCDYPRDLGATCN